MRGVDISDIIAVSIGPQQASETAEIVTDDVLGVAALLQGEQELVADDATLVVQPHELQASRFGEDADDVLGVAALLQGQQRSRRRRPSILSGSVELRMMSKKHLSTSTRRLCAPPECKQSHCKIKKT